MVVIVAANALLRRRRIRPRDGASDAPAGARGPGQPARRGGCCALLEQPPGFISAIQLGVTLSSLALGAIGEPVVSGLLKRPLDLLPESWHTASPTTISVILAFTILTYFHVVMGEIVPKSFTLQHPERVALLVAGPISVFHAIFRPFIWVLVRSSAAVLRWFGVTAGERHGAGALRGGAEDARHREPREGRAGGGGAGDAPQGVRVRRQGRGRRDGAAARRGRRAASTCRCRTCCGSCSRTRSRATRCTRGELDDIVGVLHVRDLFSALHERGLQSVRRALDPARRRSWCPRRSRSTSSWPSSSARRTTSRSWSTSTARSRAW